MEFIYVVKRYDLFELEFPHGFLRLSEKELRSRFLDKIDRDGFFAQRDYCEKDSGFKQIIPYSVITHADRVFLLKRYPTQGESRLHNKLSIGVGGHINPIDGAENLLAAGCLREISEELDIDEEFVPKPVGIINDESNPVGSVHFGIVHHVRLAKGMVRIRESSMMEGEFVPIQELKRRSEELSSDFETWSSLIVQGIDEIVSI
jgi:predicted NUDIX family phosphoesterase